MKILVNTLVILVAAALGLAVGFALRGKFKKSAASAELSTIVETSSTGAGPSRSSGRDTRIRTHDDSPLATKLERDLSMSSGVTRWLYWIEAIDKAGPSDFPRLVRLAEGNSTATRFIAARWAEIAPRHLFDTIVAASKDGTGSSLTELATVLFEEWPKRDADAAVAALSGTNYFGQRDTWRMRVATTLFDQDVERGLKLMSEWHIDNYGPRQTAVAKWAAANPQHAAEFAFEHPAGYASQLTMETIGKEWAKTDPARALEFAASRPGELGSRLASAAIKEWAGRDLDKAAEWLAGVDDSTRNRLSPTFVEAWAKQDARDALIWCQENLSGSSLAPAVGAVLKGIADKDLPGAAALVSAMDPSRARAEAAVSVARKWFPQSFSDSKPVSPETVTWLSGLDHDSLKRVLDEVHWRWSQSDPDGMASFLTTMSEPPSQYAYTSLARQLARKNPTEALEWAGRLPGNSAAEAATTVFTEWRRSQPETAMKWLNELPAKDPRFDPFFKDTIRELAYDPQAGAHLAAMPAANRAAARTIIETSKLPEDRRNRLLDILKAQ